MSLGQRPAKAVLDEEKVLQSLKMAPSKVALNIRGSAAYKKKQGSLGISSDRKSIIWTPIDSGSSVSIAVANITSTSI